MASIDELRSIAKQAAAATLAPTEVIDVDIGDAIGADGDAILRIRIVVPEGQVGTIDGQRLLRTLMGVKLEIAKVGEDRRSIVTYATPSEQATRGDPEP